MKISLSWLKDYVKLNWPPEKLARELTMRSIEVKTIEKGCVFDEKLIIGQVKVVSKHPHADKLKLAVVDIGSRAVKVVCGAPNLEEGQKVVLAPVGAVLRPIKGDEIKIRPAVIRGVESPGMICSEAELGLSEEAQGILVLPQDTRVGQSLKDYFGTKDTVFDLDVLSNRPDLLGHLGVAREIAAIAGVSLKQPRDEIKDPPQKKIELQVEISDSQICPRYSALVISGIKIKDSPKLIADRLLACGLRPINNIVDLTNYLMLDLGQPFHAFNYLKIAGGLMRVRPAKKGELVTTLDGISRKLATGVPIIEDQEKLIDLAGIMGGANTEIDQSTKIIVLQAAVFDAVTIRRASRLLGLRTDAVGCYEKGVDLTGTMTALVKAYHLLKQQLPSVQLEQVVDLGQKTISWRKINLELNQVEKLLGLSLKGSVIQSILDSLGMKTTKIKKDCLEVTIPSFRPDLKLEEDLIEEIARIYGYDQLPETVISAELKPHFQEPERRITIEISQVLVGLGFNEVINYSFVPGKFIERLGLKTASHLEIANPLSEEQRYLRSELLSSLLATASRNLRFWDQIKLFELGRVYTPLRLGQMEEKSVVGGMVCLANKAESFAYAKGALTHLWQKLNLAPREEIVQPDRNLNCPHWQAYDKESTLKFVQKKDVLGTVSLIVPQVAASFDLNAKMSVVYFMVFLETLIRHAGKVREYHELPRFPAVNLDLAITVPREVKYREIELVIKQTGGQLLKRVELFDVYQGKQTKDKLSLAFHLDYRAADQTLELKEAQALHQAIAAKLKSRCGAELR